MKLLLIQPPWLRFFGCSTAAPPLALNYLAAFLRHHRSEWSVDVYNADFGSDHVAYFPTELYSRRHVEYTRRLKNSDDPIWREIESKIRQFAPDIVGITSMTASFESALQVSRIVRRINPEISVVVGGKHVSALPRESLQNKSIDIVVIGEGEETLAELLSSMDSLWCVPGIAFRDSHGDTLVTGSRIPIKDINHIPFPIHESSLNESYFGGSGIRRSVLSWNIIGARGCPYQCIYCAADRTVRFRTPENIVREIEEVRSRYGLRNFNFVDDSFSLNRERAEKICQLLEPLSIRWYCSTRVDLIDEEIAYLMRRSGCVSVSIGIETGSTRTRERIKKKIDPIQVEKAIKYLHSYNVPVKAYFIIGFPWEDESDFADTLRLINRLPIDDFQISIATPLPGTQMFDDLVSAGKINPAMTDWVRFQQGSFFMNFSALTDEEWYRLLMKYTSKANRILPRKRIGKLIRMFRNEPMLAISTLSFRMLKKIGLPMHGIKHAE